MDDEEAAREWADEEARKVGMIWIRRWPKGKDWEVKEEEDHD